MQLRDVCLVKPDQHDIVLGKTVPVGKCGICHALILPSDYLEHLQYAHIHAPEVQRSAAYGIIEVLDLKDKS